MEELRKQVDTNRRLFLLNVSDEAEQELVTEQIKSLVRELQQIKGDSGLRAKLLLGKWAAAQELDTDTPMDCKECILKNSKGWGQSVKLGPHSAIWGKLGTALQAYTLNPCTKFPPNPTSRKVNT